MTYFLSVSGSLHQESDKSLCSKYSFYMQTTEVIGLAFELNKDSNVCKLNNRFASKPITFYVVSTLHAIRSVRPQGYKTFFKLNSTEHEIYPDHKC